MICLTLGEPISATISWKPIDAEGLVQQKIVMHEYVSFVFLVAYKVRIMLSQLARKMLIKTQANNINLLLLYISIYQLRDIYFEHCSSDGIKSRQSAT